MPTYDYECSACKHRFEELQSFSDEPLKTCEKCGGELEKQWSLSGFQFKGAGWYVTDYAKKSGGSAAGADKSDKSESGEKSDKTEKSDAGEKTSVGESTAKAETASNTTSDAKPATKTETTTKKE